jgi:hypothetical protein
MHCVTLPPRHPFAQRQIAGGQKQVDMVGHEHPGMHLDAMALGVRPEMGREKLARRTRSEEVLPALARAGEE